MNKLWLLIFFSLIVILSCKAQMWCVEVESGIGMYAMDDMKTLQKQYSNNTMKVVQSFPPSLFFRGILSITPIKGWRTGLAYTSMSTGGRNDYQDYSGLMRHDMVISSHCLGIINSYELPFNNFSLSANVNVSRSASTLSMHYQLSFTGQNASNNYDEYGSVNVLIDGFLKGSYTLKNFKTGLFVGYCFDPKSDLELGQQPFSSSHSVDWSGLRAGISFGYKF